MTDTAKIISNKTIARNSMYNLLGQGLPIFVAIFSMPLLVKTLGVERLGVLTIAWMFIGYFSIFDFGLGRALTKLVAGKIGTNEKEDIPSLICTALALMGGLGIIGGLLLAITAEYATYSVLKISPLLQRETLNSLYCISFSIPIITTTAGLRGVLEANQLFKGINVIRFMLGIATYLAPVVVCFFSRNVSLIVAALVVARLAAWFMHVYLCSKVYPIKKRNFFYKKSFVKPLLAFGGWMTTVNMCSPFLVYIERFFIGAFLPVTFVAYYTTPYDMATKLWILPGALTGTLLPVFSTISVQSSEITNALYQRILRYVLLCMFPISITIVTFSQEILFYWLGHEFSYNGSIVLQLITIGVFINSFAQVAFVLLQSFGRPDVLAKILLVEIPLYIPLLMALVKSYGINGAAIAWLIRVIIDTALFLVMSFNYSKTPALFQRVVMAVICMIGISFASVLVVHSLFSRVSVYIVCIAIFVVSACKCLVTQDEFDMVICSVKQYLRYFK